MTHDEIQARLDAIVRREAQATRGPWHARCAGLETADVLHFQQARIGREPVATLTTHEISLGMHGYVGSSGGERVFCADRGLFADLDFVVSAREDVPFLLAELAALRGLVADLYEDNLASHDVIRADERRRCSAALLEALDLRRHLANREHDPDRRRDLDHIATGVEVGLHALRLLSARPAAD